MTDEELDKLAESLVDHANAALYNMTADERLYVIQELAHVLDLIVANHRAMHESLVRWQPEAEEPEDAKR